jgi:hypothetical protein
MIRFIPSGLILRFGFVAFIGRRQIRLGSLPISPFALLRFFCGLRRLSSGACGALARRLLWLDTIPKLGEGGTSNLESTQQLACVRLDVPSTDRTKNATVRLCPTDCLMKLVAAIRTWKV